MDEEDGSYGLIQTDYGKANLGGGVAGEPQISLTYAPSHQQLTVLSRESRNSPLGSALLLFQTRSIQSRFLQSRNLNCIALCEGG